MPPLPKLETTRSCGVQIVLSGEVFDETLQRALEFAKQNDAMFISAFDHTDIVLGQGAVASLSGVSFDVGNRNLNGFSIGSSVLCAFADVES